MEITLTVRHTELPERFRRHLEEKLAKVGQVAPRADRLDVVVSHEPNPRQASACERVELTLRHKREVVRAEACADDAYGALDLAEGKILERVRRLRDRKRVHHGRQTPTSVREATATDLLAAGAGAGDGTGPGPDGSVLQEPTGVGVDLAVDGSAPAVTELDDADVADGADDMEDADGHPPRDSVGNTPVRIREKTHLAHPMSVEEALAQMEAVGHDFYLFLCKDTGVTSLVYRRRGWSYGVIRLQEATDAGEGAEAGDTARSVQASTA